MQRNYIGKFFIGAFVTIVLVFGLYNLPPIHNRLAWRVDFALTYLRGILYPANNAPAPVNVTASLALTSTPTITSTASLSSPTPENTPEIPPTPTFTPTPMPSEVALTPPEYEKQGINDCGPTTLSMYLRFYGWDGTQDTINEKVKPLPGDRNVNVEELDGFIRNEVGWLSTQYRVGGTLDLIRNFLSSGIPVMIEETFKMDEPYWPNDDMWAGHYLLITGYNDDTQLFVTQDSYYGANRPVSYDELDTNWEAFNRVIIVVYLPEQEETVKNIFGADWDPDVNRQHALDTATQETETDPQDAFAWFNKGTNLVYFERYSEAVDAYDTAREIGLPQRMYRYQFGPFIADFHARRTDDLLALTEYALERTPNSEEAMLWRGWALYRQGETEQARELFQKALEANSTYYDAQYALDYINTPQ